MTDTIDMDEYNHRAFLANFPPELRWEKVEGVMSQGESTPADSLVSISGLDHKGEYVKFWVNIPNAMYLLNLLAQLQQQTGAAVPSEQPGVTNPHS